MSALPRGSSEASQWWFNQALMQADKAAEPYKSSSGPDVKAWVYLWSDPVEKLEPEEWE